jgi:hypothetical protein
LDYRYISKRYTVHTISNHLFCVCFLLGVFLILHYDWAHCQEPHWILDLSHDPASPATISRHFICFSVVDIYVFSDDRRTCAKVLHQEPNIHFLFRESQTLLL